MKVFGKIKELDKIIVSDPFYSKDVSCRYERNNLNCKDWKIDIEIHPIQEEIDGISVEGTEFFVLLQDPKECCNLKADGSFSYYSKNKINEIKIGMDSACVALGINTHADNIKKSKDTWQPEFALKTLTDGFFGYVKEGCSDGKINFIWITGFLDNDTDYTADDLAKYLTTKFNVTELAKEINITTLKDDVDYEI